MLAAAWSVSAPARSVLARLLAPLGWDGILDRGPLGAPGSPWLRARGLSVSLSHADGLAAACVARGGPCGVDIETVDASVDIHAVAETVLPASAVRQVAAAPDPREAFFRLWTLSEAALKTLGVGFSNPVDGLEITLGPLMIIGAAPADSAWSAFELAPAPSHRLAAAMLAADGAEVRMIAGPLT
ncbi:4'-phosphopantetheinyl transferase family protein [Caulobacter mirabilis]|uniref:4'-phosphopantetheinyl transferase family protein n=1 Tax=Caulobacter mirabilis TaxID=69666 RepID=UPI0015591974|nr:4'-phosphopantetheinyl transferase superfamily protein [Caulobacter mirabilis]